MSGRSILGMAQIRFQMNQNSKAKLRAEQIIRVTLRICMQFTLHWGSGFQIGFARHMLRKLDSWPVASRRHRSSMRVHFTPP